MPLNCKRLNTHGTYLSFNTRAERIRELNPAVLLQAPLSRFAPKITIRASIKYQLGSGEWLGGVVLSSACRTSPKKRDRDLITLEEGKMSVCATFEHI